MNSDRRGLTLVDAHVHFHTCFETTVFFERAWDNFESSGSSFFGQCHPSIGVLLLADTHRTEGFDRLAHIFGQQRKQDNANSGAWKLHDTNENTSLYLTSGSNKVLVVIAGRQLVTRENLEVIAIGTRRRFERGMATEALIQEIVHTDALPVLPWGFGKWMGARGRVVEQLLRNPELPQFFLGDSGNRPALWPRSSLFRLAEERGIEDLPGSDPLPFPSEVARPGSFGFAMEGSLSFERPTQDLKDKLFNKATAIRRFGTGETLIRFVGNQLAMQYRKLIAS